MIFQLVNNPGNKNNDCTYYQQDQQQRLNNNTFVIDNYCICNQKVNSDTKHNNNITQEMLRFDSCGNDSNVRQQLQQLQQHCHDVSIELF